MSEKDYQILMELAEKKLQKGYTKEEALYALYFAGILDENGNFTKPYQNLASVVINK